MLSYIDVQWDYSKGEIATTVLDVNKNKRTRSTKNGAHTNEAAKRSEAKLSASIPRPAKSISRQIRQIYIYIYLQVLSSVLLGFSRHPRCRRSTSCFHPQSSLLFSCHLPPRRSTTCSHPQSGLKQGLKKQLFHLSAIASTALTHHNLRAGTLEARDKRQGRIRIIHAEKFILL